MSRASICQEEMLGQLAGLMVDGTGVTGEWEEATAHFEISKILRMVAASFYLNEIMKYMLKGEC